MKVFGTTHAFHDIADTDGTHVSTENFTDIKYDPDTTFVTFGAGVIYTKLIEALVKEGRAITNMPSLPHLNVVGTVVTGTHGSGLAYQSIATYVRGVAYVDSKGNHQRLNYPDPDLDSFLHSFGTLGIIYEMTMATEPEYGIKKCIYKDVPFDFLKDPELFDRVNREKDYISFFSDLKDERFNSVWTGDRYYASEGKSYEEMGQIDYKDLCDADFHGGELIYNTNPAPEFSSDNCVGSGFGMWSEKIYHFKPDQPPACDGEEIGSEFYVRYSDLPAAVMDIYNVSKTDMFKDLIYFIELRAVAEDGRVNLSPARYEDVFGIHFHYRHDFERTYQGVQAIQDVLAKYDYSVHYGKFFHARPEIFNRFQSDIKRLQRELNSKPSNVVFGNCWAARVIFGADSCPNDSHYEKFADIMDQRIADQKKQDEL